MGTYTVHLVGELKTASAQVFIIVIIVTNNSDIQLNTQLYYTVEIKIIAFGM